MLPVSKLDGSKRNGRDDTEESTKKRDDAKKRSGNAKEQRQKIAELMSVLERSSR